MTASSFVNFISSSLSNILCQCINTSFLLRISIYKLYCVKLSLRFYSLFCVNFQTLVSSEYVSKFASAEYVAKMDVTGGADDDSDESSMSSISGQQKYFMVFKTQRETQEFSLSVFPATYSELTVFSLQIIQMMRSTTWSCSRVTSLQHTTQSAPTKRSMKNF